MRYYVIDRGDSLSVELTESFHSLAAEQGLELDPVSPDIVVSIGGDGTMLKAFHMFIDRLDSIAFVGVHTGHLGFYADWKADEIDELVHRMSGYTELGQPHQRVVQYPLIKLDIQRKSGPASFICLNEFTIKGVDGTVVAGLEINDQMFEMFRGDGICVSTPSGSTAYNKSVGGAMIHPTIEALQIAEIASINNRIFRTIGSPLVLPKHHHCDIYSGKDQNLILTVDHVNTLMDDLVSIRCQVAEEKISFIRYRPFPFWDRVRNAFLG